MSRYGKPVVRLRRPRLSLTPIAVGRYGEEFVDGATGANNPVMELWNQAQLIWGPQPLED